MTGLSSPYSQGTTARIVWPEPNRPGGAVSERVASAETLVLSCDLGDPFQLARVGGLERG